MPFDQKRSTDQGNKWWNYSNGYLHCCVLVSTKFMKNAHIVKNSQCMNIKVVPWSKVDFHEYKPEVLQSTIWKYSRD